jgi:hypothetical protein
MPSTAAPLPRTPDSGQNHPHDQRPEDGHDSRAAAHGEQGILDQFPTPTHVETDGRIISLVRNFSPIAISSCNGIRQNIIDMGKIIIQSRVSDPSRH